MKDFRDFYFLILGIFLWIFLLIPLIIIPLIIPLTIYKILVNFIAKKLRPDLIPVSPTDSIFTSHPTKLDPVINPTQVWKLKGKLNLETFKKHFHQTFLSNKKEDGENYQNLFCYFEEFMFYVFKKRISPLELDLSRHIYEINIQDLDQFVEKENCNGNLDKNVDENDGVIDKFIGRWMAQHTFPKDGPSWEIVIIQPKEQGDDGRGDSVLCFKIHHGLCDGYSFVHIIEKLTGIKSPYIIKEKKKLNWWTKIRFMLQASTTTFYIWGQVSFSKEVLYPRKVANPNWYISFTTLDLDLVKIIRRKTQTHFVNILMSVQTGALRRFFLKSEKVSSEMDLPTRMGIAHSLGWPFHPAMNGKGLANHLTLGGYHIPLRDTDPLRRLLATEEEFLEFESRGCCELVNWVFFNVLWITPGFMMRYLLTCNLGWMRYTHLFSSLMCSSQEYNLLGLPLKNLYLPLVTNTISPNCSIYTVSTSHSGQLDLSINGSSEVFKDQKELDIFTQIYFQEEIRNLARACEIQCPE